MALAELRERMRGWLAGEYRAVVFLDKGQAVAYALYRESENEVYLRQMLVSRDRRRRGIGRQAVEILRTRIWPSTKRLTVEVLTRNTAAVDFWRAVGYKDYSLTLEIIPKKLP